MRLDSENSRYYGDSGWPSDPALFAEVAVNWKHWIGHASEHLYAAQLLLSSVQQRDREIERLVKGRVSGQVRLVPSLTAIYFLHCAVAIENSFKGVIAVKHVAKIKREMNDTHRVPNILLGHDLVVLAQRAGFYVGTDEEYMLAFLSRYGTWAGRYPIPLRNVDNGVTDELSNGNYYMTGGYRTDHVPAFAAFSGTIYSWASAAVDVTQSGETREGRGPA